MDGSLRMGQRAVVLFFRFLNLDVVVKSGLNGLGITLAFQLSLSEG